LFFGSVNILSMKVVALIAVRNEMLYLERCLQHLFSQGIQVGLIDNGSSDGTLECAKQFLGEKILRIEHVPYAGEFDLAVILRLKERLACEIEADWFIHQDADEIREAPRGWGTLAEGIRRADREGFNAINFDEFVFTPAEGENHEHQDYVRTMRHYYFFQPAAHLRVNAWKKTDSAVDLESLAGHKVQFEGQTICPQPFVLRHYPLLSRSHLNHKYGVARRYAQSSLARGWSHSRANFDSKTAELPDGGRLKTYSESGWDTSDPWGHHPFLGSR